MLMSQKQIAWSQERGAHLYIIRTLEGRDRKTREVQDQPQLHSEFKADLGYMKSYLKEEEEEEEEGGEEQDITKKKWFATACCGLQRVWGCRCEGENPRCGNLILVVSETQKSFTAQGR